MADKSFGVKELNLLNASGTPTVTSPNNLNLNANTVAISTSCTIGSNLDVDGTTNLDNVDIVGITTIRNASGTKLYEGSANGSKLFHAGTERLSTETYGIDINGTLGADQINCSGVSTITIPANANPHSSWDVVNNGASSYRFTGPGQDGAEDNPDIYLVRGQRYVFKMNASGHPFQIRVANGGAAYSDGVTNNGAQTGNVVFNVQHDAPAQLYYQCTSHGGMVGNVYIVGGSQVISGVVTATTFSGNLSGGTVSGTTGTFSGAVQSVGLTNTISSGNVIALMDSSNAAQNHRVRINSQGASSSTSLAISNSNANNQTSLVHGNDGVFSIRNGQTAGSEPTSGTERFRILSTGQVLLGATSGGNADTDDLIVSGSGKKGITLCSTDGSESRLTFADGLSGVSAVAGSILYTHSNDSMDFQTNTTRRLRIDSVGRVMIGTIDAGGSNADDLTVATSGNTGITIRSGTSNTGNIFFSDATSGAAQYAGAIEFYHSDNSLRFNVGNTNYLRITSSGSVRIGDNSSFTADGSADELVIGASNSGVNRGISILNHTGQDGRICFAQSGDPDAGMIKYSHGSNVLQFYVESEEMVRLNNTSVQGTPAMQLRKPNAASNVQSHMIHLIVGGHDRGALIAGSSFGSSAIVGSISDYRVKTNIRNYTSGWDNIKALPVKIFDINKEGEEATDIKGWIAHEVQSVIPEAVIGTKDAKKADGSDDLQSLGYNVFMPDVVGALQTAMAKIETLEAKVAALEGS